MTRNQTEEMVRLVRSHCAGGTEAATHSYYPARRQTRSTLHIG